MAARPRLGPERLSEVLQAAMAVFARAGFHQARMEDIAQEAGLAKGTLYLYFKTKDDLIAAILHRLFSGELARWRTCRPSMRPPASACSPSPGASPTSSGASPCCCRSGSNSMPWPRAEKGCGSSSRSTSPPTRAPLAALIQQGIDRGEFRAVDAEQAALTFIALFEGLTLLWAIDPQAITVETTPEAAVRLLLEGLDARQSGAAERRTHG